MAGFRRVLPLVSSLRVRPVIHSGLVLPKPLVGDAALTLITSDTNHVGWITHPDNPAATATVAATSASSVYPIANIKALPSSKTWRSTSLATQDITIDFGTATGVAVDIIALVNHNLSAGATVSIAAGTTTGYSDFSASMTYRTFTEFVWLSAPQTYRYWRIRIANATNPDGFIEVGYLVAGILTKPEYTFRQGWVSTTQIKTSEVFSEFGTRTSEELYRKQSLAFSFGPLNEIDMYYVRRLHATVKKNIYPALILPSRGGTDAYFGKLEGVLEIKSDYRKYADVLFNEDSFGQSIET